MPKLIILTGPQGTGNHLYSKLLALNPSVYGWKDLLNQYWIGHDREPFAEYWIEPQRLSTFNWQQSQYFVTSISCPYALNGEYVTPDYNSFLEYASKYAQIQIGIISRDQTIVELQQQRVRVSVTLPKFLDNMDLLTRYPHVFLSQETLTMYGIWYLPYIERKLGLPVSEITTQHVDLFNSDANKKYIKSVESQDLDIQAQKASSKWRY